MHWSNILLTTILTIKNDLMLDPKLKSMDIFQPKTSYLPSLVLFMIYICDKINLARN